MIMRSDPWNTRSTVSRWAHVLTEQARLGWWSCGLFVAAEVAKANIDLLGSGGPILAMMLGGAAGFYLGIDLPPPPSPVKMPLWRRVASRADAVELLSAAGTFLASAAAVVSVCAIILDEFMGGIGTLLIGCSWAIGATMQIGAGIFARTRADDSVAS